MDGAPHDEVIALRDNRGLLLLAVLLGMILVPLGVLLGGNSGTTHIRCEKDANGRGGCRVVEKAWFIDRNEDYPLAAITGHLAQLRHGSKGRRAWALAIQTRAGSVSVHQATSPSSADANAFSAGMKALLQQPGPFRFDVRMDNTVRARVVANLGLAYVLLLLALIFVQPRIIVSRGAGTLLFRRFRALPWGVTTVNLADIRGVLVQPRNYEESELLLELSDGPQLRLRSAGDAELWQLQGLAGQLRDALGLLDPATTAPSAPDVTEGPRCPRCRVVSVLRPGTTELGDLVCIRCRGHHLPAEGTEKLLTNLGLNLGMLRELAAMHGGRPVRCAGCSLPASVLPLRGHPVDVCLACGAMWVDAGELSAISLGRYSDEPAVASSAAPQPAAPAEHLEIVRAVSPNHALGCLGILVLLLGGGALIGAAIIFAIVMARLPWAAWLFGTAAVAAAVGVTLSRVRFVFDGKGGLRQSWLVFGVSLGTRRFSVSNPRGVELRSHTWRTKQGTQTAYFGYLLLPTREVLVDTARFHSVGVERAQRLATFLRVPMQDAG